MRVVIFTHSLISDWNHGNAHFLRGVAAELMARGHELRIFEPLNGWSLQSLLADAGPAAVRNFETAYPHLRSRFYDPETLDLDRELAGADLVLVHEWNPHDLVRRIGEHRARSGGYKLLFHDTHHRSLTDREGMARYDLANYDGVLAYGNVIRDIYRAEGWKQQVWTWHEAADARVFFPRDAAHEGDVVWIGNWGDGERAEEIDEFLIRPVKDLGLKARVYGVRYPRHALEKLEAAGIEYAGWLPNYRVPEVFARYRVTVHIPRRPYASTLRGIPTIRPFEALACGIPLISAPWDDCEHLFTPGKDYLLARDGSEMRRQLRALLTDYTLARRVAARGLRTIRARHTCAHRVDELLEIVKLLDVRQALSPALCDYNSVLT
jgi:spore maturation protein CgeB